MYYPIQSICSFHLFHMQLSGNILTTHPLIPKQLFGGHKVVARPDPIPNSDVKHHVADGSAGIARVRVGSRQIFIYKSDRTHTAVFFVFSYSFLLLLIATEAWSFQHWLSDKQG